MANENQYNWSPQEVAEARKALLSYYTEQQSSQGTRLIGFVIGLFTLLQLAQASKNSGFRGVFPNFPSVIEATNAPFWDFLKVVFLFFGTAIIMYFILRTIFRFSVYGYLSNQILVVTKDYAKTVVTENVSDLLTKGKTVDKEDVSKYEDEYYAFNLATSRRVYEHKKIFGLPSAWFFTLEDIKCPVRDKIGVRILSIISVALSFLVILFLW